MAFFLYVCLTIAYCVGTYLFVIWALSEPKPKHLSEEEIRRKKEIDEVVDKFNIPLIVITVITLIGLFYFMKG